MEPIQVIETAIKDEHLVKGVAARMGLHKNTLYVELADPKRCRYSRFLQLFLSIDAENSLGADAIFEDFRARVVELRHERASGPKVRSDWIGAVAKVVQETGESIESALVEGDPAHVEKEIVEAISALRGLLGLCVRRQKLSVAGAGKSESGHR